MIEVASIPGWSKRKGSRNGYVMLCNVFSGTQKPIVLVLDYTRGGGGLTYRQLHVQIRAFLKLEPKVSLRMIASRPWYRYLAIDCTNF